MYVSKITMKNIRCFDDVTLNFFTKDSPCLGCVLLGDNGFGKTTVLRSIALSLCGQKSVSGLLDELYGEWIKNEKPKGSIVLEMVDPDRKNELFKIITTFLSNGTIEQETIPKEEFPWDDIFACGYGILRGVYGERTIEEYYITDSVYTLINYKYEHLQNPELTIRRIADALNFNDSDVQGILDIVSSILMFNKGAIKLGKGKGLMVELYPGKSIPLQQLGDGHIATATMLIDFIGWQLLYDVETFRSDISKFTGIFLIDEIEQHLHPLWKRNIIPLLRTKFPKVQFIITTHSPLIAANIRKDLKSKDSKLFYLNKSNNIIQVNEIEENIEELNLDQLLASEAFGHIFTVNKEIEKVLRQASELAAKDVRSSDEEIKYQKIKEILKDVKFLKGRTLIERDVERDYYKDLKKEKERLKKILEGKKDDPD
ncbi:MAG: AAA family ATPase [Candidatus Thermoplasmatota archaeon]|nr:AAA family ATPase [Candidatus Thermoplasmatota archaeon]